MTSVLISSVPHDIHAAAVRCALARKGHHAIAWFNADLPQRLTASVRLGGDRATSVHLDDTSLDDVGAVWLRRPATPVLPDDMHPADRPIAARELDTFHRGLLSVVAPDAFWVNTLDSMRRASSKLLQLREATACGLAIPDTLVSNDPTRIRSFLRGHGGAIIYKPLRPALWNGATGLASVFTSLITEDVLPDDDVLRLTAGIFQPLVPKLHELRVTYLGDHVIVARVLSQHDEALRVDWRATGGKPPLEPDTLPPSIDRACRALMRRLGLVFGCIDLIVTPDGDHVFLEVNEMGQWLWIEELLPELHLLDAFTELLAQARPDFAWSPTAPIRFADVEAEARALVAADEATHIESLNEFVTNEDEDDDEEAPVSATR
jgi:hypothetical protein